MATLEQCGQTAADTVPNLQPSGAKSDASSSRCFAAGVEEEEEKKGADHQRFVLPCRAR